jgi:hypothetical protein
MRMRYRSPYNSDYPPEWDDPDEDIEQDEDDFIEPDDDYDYVDDRLTDLEIRYNRGY